jgi:hypothetical protein
MGMDDTTTPRNGGMAASLPPFLGVEFFETILFSLCLLIAISQVDIMQIVLVSQKTASQPKLSNVCSQITAKITSSRRRSSGKKY